MIKYTIAFLFLSSFLSNAAVTWTGNAGTDIFDGGNYSGLADGFTLGPNVTVEDDITFSNATVTIPQVSAQQRFQVASGFTMTVDGSNFSLSGGSNDGIGGAPGSRLPAGPAGPTINIINGSSLEAFFIVNGVQMNVDGTSSVTLGGAGNPVNISSINLDTGATLSFTRETIAQFNTEHLSKITINGTAAQEGLNFTIDALGAGGSTITAIPEPSAGLLGAIGCIIFVLRRRR
ncbi:MAG: hypothetical protein QF426_10020 [Verrucomicrobiales bacterium]|jgi:hypothetical protein|nr:hypothetical protein [Verrucomicrobiales bacterium]